MTLFSPPIRAFVREVSARYAACLRSDRGPEIDVGEARRQQAAYASVLRSLGVEVETLAADDDAPDCCFIEDTAVIVGQHAVATIPGAPGRRGEVAPVAAALEGGWIVRRMEAPATLDGGDVLRAGSRLFVGLSTRTNQAGVAFLAQVAALEGVSVVALAVRGGLHLKSACTLASESVLVFDPAMLDDEALSVFRAAGLACEAAPEAAGANVLALGRSVVVSAAAPRTAELLARRGLDVRPVDVSEMHKGDGALTCLSLRAAPRGAWCA